MNKNKRITRIAATFMLATTMLAGSVMPAFAAVPTTTITASNADGAASVKAYRIVEGTYSGDNFTGFKAVSGVTIADLEKPTATEITTIANNLSGLTAIDMKDDGTSGDTTASDGTFAATVTPGLYLVIATSSGEKIFNPGLVAVNVAKADLTQDKPLTAGTLDFESPFHDGTIDKDVYLKSSEPGFDKQISTADKLSGKDDTVVPGETIEFTLDKMTVPSYSDDYASPVYEITDELETGKFAGISNIAVYVGGVDDDHKVTASDNTYSIKDINNGTFTDDGTSTSFKISFAETYIKNNPTTAGQAIVIKYNTKLTADAGINFDENTNHATVKYSNNPSDASSFKTITKNTYHYTFGIDASIDASSVAENKTETHELNKVKKANGDYEPVDSVKYGTGTKTSSSVEKLAGAQFALFTDETCTTAVQTKLDTPANITSTSDANGHIFFTGLDQGTYYMKETVAPASYTLNPTVYKIEIKDATFTADGALTGYSIAVSAKAAGETAFGTPSTTTYNLVSGKNPTINADGGISYDEGTTSIINVATDGKIEILNTTIPGLPSTGGAGTLGFILAAITLAGGFVVFSNATKEKK